MRFTGPAKNGLFSKKSLTTINLAAEDALFRLVMPRKPILCADPVQNRGGGQRHWGSLAREVARFTASGADAGAPTAGSRASQVL
jgi:hypothetical protein